MNFLPQFLVAMPEIFLLTMTCLILLIDVFLPEQQRIITYFLAQIALAATFILLVIQFHHYPVPTVIFNGQYVIDRLAIIAKLFVCLFSFFCSGLCA